MLADSLAFPSVVSKNGSSSLSSLQKPQKQEGNNSTFSPRNFIQGAIDDAIAGVKLSSVPKVAGKAVETTGLNAELRNFMQASIQDAKKFFTDAFKDFGKGAENIPGLNGDLSGIKGNYHALFQQAEKAVFETKGSVTTADGKEVSFSLSIEIKAVYQKEVSIQRIPAGGSFPPPGGESGSDFANSLLSSFDFGGKGNDLFHKLFLFDLFSKEGKGENKGSELMGKGLLQFGGPLQKGDNKENVLNMPSSDGTGL